MSFSLFILNSVLLGVGLSMDAFSVSVADGLQETDMSRRRQAAIAGIYALFQFAMPLLGYLLTGALVTFFRQFQALIPWVSLALLAVIGGNMIFEGVRGEAVTAGAKKLGNTALLLQGIATSIDALSVGLTFSSYTFPMVLFSAVIIGAVTFAVCAAGLSLGKYFGEKISGRARIVGGAILIAIGLEIFVRGMFFG